MKSGETLNATGALRFSGLARQLQARNVAPSGFSGLRTKTSRSTRCGSDLVGRLGKKPPIRTRTGVFESEGSPDVRLSAGTTLTCVAPDPPPSAVARRASRSRAVTRRRWTTWRVSST